MLIIECNSLIEIKKLISDLAALRAAARSLGKTQIRILLDGDLYGSDLPV